MFKKIYFISYTNKFIAKNILVTNIHGKKIKWKIHLGEGNLIFWCTCAADPNFWQTKIITTATTTTTIIIITIIS